MKETQCGVPLVAHEAQATDWMAVCTVKSAPVVPLVSQLPGYAQDAPKAGKGQQAGGQRGGELEQADGDRPQSAWLGTAGREGREWGEWAARWQATG